MQSVARPFVNAKLKTRDLKFSKDLISTLIDDQTLIPSKEPQSKLQCEAEYNDKYAKCIADCENNAECISSCNRDYDQSVSDCPCNANCPNGCPCLNYDCDKNKPKTSVLVLNTFSSTNPALITDANGTTDTNFWFKMDTEVYDSCSISYGS